MLTYTESSIRGIKADDRQACSESLASEQAGKEICGGWTLSLWLNLLLGSNRKAHSPCWRLRAEWRERPEKTAHLIGPFAWTRLTDTDTQIWYCMNDFSITYTQHNSGLQCKTGPRLKTLAEEQTSWHVSHPEKCFQRSVFLNSVSLKRYGSQ